MRNCLDCEVLNKKSAKKVNKYRQKLKNFQIDSQINIKKVAHFNVLPDGLKHLKYYIPFKISIFEITRLRRILEWLNS